jgi:hypothetical protein
MVMKEGTSINTDRILATLEERRKWEQRRDDVESEMKYLSSTDKARRKEELSRINEQISYYDSLLADMKKEIRPSDRHSILGRG